MPHSGRWRLWPARSSRHDVAVCPDCDVLPECRAESGDGDPEQ